MASFDWFIGAFFNLYADAACSTAPVVSNAEAVRGNTSDPFVVSIAGTALAVSTTYYLKEVTAPTGYDLASAVYECKVAADGSITYKIQGSASSYSSTIPICSNAVHVVTVNNIQLTKTFADDAITGLNSGAFFTLYADSACVTTPVKTNVEAVRSSISNPFIVTIDGTGLSAATTYYLKEVTAPAGYDMSTNIYECKVAADGSVTYKIKGSADAYSSTFPTCINVVHTPTPAPLPIVPSDIAIIKTFENNKITGLASGAYFTLYSDAACTIPVVNNMQAIRSNLTDSFKATIPGNLLSVSMSYYLKEVTAPSGYAKSNNIYICNIDAAGVVTYKLLGSTNLFSASFPSCNNTEVQNPTLGAIKIKILEKGTGRAISNAVVYLTLPNGQKKMFSTDANGEIAISNQEIGTYSLVVQSVPTGYQYDVGATYSLDVASNNVAEKTITVETVTTNGSSNTTGTTTKTTTAAQTSAVKLKKLDKVPATGMR